MVPWPVPKWIHSSPDLSTNTMREGTSSCAVEDCVGRGQGVGRFEGNMSGTARCRARSTDSPPETLHPLSGPFPAAAHPGEGDHERLARGQRRIDGLVASLRGALGPRALGGQAPVVDGPVQNVVLGVPAGLKLDLRSEGRESKRGRKVPRIAAMGLRSRLEKSKHSRWKEQSPARQGRALGRIEAERCAAPLGFALARSDRGGAARGLPPDRVPIAPKALPRRGARGRVGGLTVQPPGMWEIFARIPCSNSISALALGEISCSSSAPARGTRRGRNLSVRARPSRYPLGAPRLGAPRLGAPGAYRVAPARARGFLMPRCDAARPNPPRSEHGARMGEGSRPAGVENRPIGNPAGSQPCTRDQRARSRPRVSRLPETGEFQPSIKM